MHAALAGNNTAGRDGRAALLDGGRGGGIYLGVSAKAEVVVAREINALGPFDSRRGGRNTFLDLEKRIGNSDFTRAIADEPVTLVARMLVKARPCFRNFRTTNGSAPTARSGRL